MPSPTRMSRKFGIEMEGYINVYPRNISITGAGIKRDASLFNSGWSYGYGRYGVEIVSRPIKNLGIVNRICGEMMTHGWSQDEKAGTHVHIDISDYRPEDKIKLLRFCKGIERIMFLFVKNYRNGNRYCNKLPDNWRKAFKLNSGEMSSLRYSTNSKYFWCNVYGSRHTTAEFRIFHCVESGEQAVKFIRLAHAIVELCKNATQEQLEFIILSLYESKDVDSCVANFNYVLGIAREDALPVVGQGAQAYLVDKLKKNAERRKKQAVKEMQELVSVGA